MSLGGKLKGRTAVLERGVEEVHPGGGPGRHQQVWVPPGGQAVHAAAPHTRLTHQLSPQVGLAAHQSLFTEQQNGMVRT